MSAHSDILDKIEARRRALFQTYVDLRRDAQDSEDFEAHRFVAEAYQAFLRSFLASDERAVLEMQDEIASLQAELKKWRSGLLGARS